MVLILLAMRCKKIHEINLVVPIGTKPFYGIKEVFLLVEV